MATIEYNPDSQRYVIDGVELHAGYPVTLILADGSDFETHIESDAGGWYLVGLKDSDRYNIAGLKAKGY
ncbi:DUF5348 domain-containing protein [Lactobacillus paracasei subsp. tolerans]|jgi:hypothetical protein|uniref:DUF5348 domain-containing protein n=1 Tax=Lacticaseibacillus paracasei TaxID=1597 RepID=UPI001889CCE8|nr:DUF5348 domain-containing protein [Lacticaseibacillus paracasei]MBF4176238.1 DUF5348 domain-containing protein [Lacticaseibacillus paracasei subsp. tolerans]